jgi:hypothetical protein
MRVEEHAAAPEFDALMRIYEGPVEGEAGEDRADREHAERHQHRPGAFVRLIAAGAFGDGRGARLVRAGVVARMLVFGMRIGLMLVLAPVMRVVKRVLDMPGSGPARRSEEGEKMSRQL